MYYAIALAYARNALHVTLRVTQKAAKATVPFWGWLFATTGTAALAFIRAKHLHKLATEVAGGLMVLAGIAQWSVPSALIVGGLAIMAAIEVRS